MSRHGGAIRILLGRELYCSSRAHKLVPQVNAIVKTREKMANLWHKRELINELLLTSFSYLPNGSLLFNRLDPWSLFCVDSLLAEKIPWEGEFSLRSDL